MLGSGPFCGAQGQAAVQAEAGWDVKETPSGHFLFCIVAEKGRKLNRSVLSFLSSEPTGQLASVDTWKSYFILIGFQTGLLTQTWHFCICRSGKCLSFSLFIISLWLPVRIHFPLSDRQHQIFVTAQKVWNASALPFSCCLSKHTWKTSCPFIPTLGRSFVFFFWRGGRKTKKNEGGNCSVGRNPPSPFPVEEVD